MAVLLHGKHQLQWVNGTAGAIPAVLVGRWGRGGGLLLLATGPSVSTHRCVLPWSPALQFVHRSTYYLIIYKLFAFTSPL